MSGATMGIVMDFVVHVIKIKFKIVVKEPQFDKFYYIVLYFSTFSYYVVALFMELMVMIYHQSPCLIVGF